MQGLNYDCMPSCPRADNSIIKAKIFENSIAQYIRWPGRSGNSDLSDSLRIEIDRD